MTDEEKKHDDCCCKCWKKIFITLALLIIGAMIGHVMTMKHHCRVMKWPCGGREMKACWDRDSAEHHGRCRDKDEMGMHKPGCMCPTCCKERAASHADPNKAGCPMIGKEQGKPPVQEKK